MKRKFWNWVKNKGDPGISRTLFLNGEISDETWYGDEVTPQIFKDELYADSGDITVWINSPGGDVFAAAQIYNMLRDYAGHVTVKIDGLAASAASVIAVAGDTVQVSPVARVSTDSIEQGESFENQVITYERLIKSNPEYEFAGVYADQGISGTSEKRPEFQRMMEDCGNGKIDLIITKSISRFARNTTIVLNYTRELKQLGIGVYFEKNNINTLSAEGELMMTVLASFAQEESRSISENNKWSIGKRFERGEGMINTTRFMGYDKDETGDLVINKVEAKIVRRIFEMYLSGEGCHRIAKILNDEGIKTITGSKWHSSTIKGMLINEKYKGDFHIQKYYTPEGKRNHTVKNNGEVKSFYVSENHPAIVSEEEWQQVQELMQYHKEQRNIQSGNKYQNRYPMSGMLICPHCGRVKWPVGEPRVVCLPAFLLCARK